MNADKREQLQVALRNLARAHAATIEFMEQALGLVADDLDLAPLTFLRSETAKKRVSKPGTQFVDEDVLSVNYRGRSCFLGNTLSFRFFSQLAQRPNAYLTYEELFSEVWQCDRSDAAVRSVVKRLRSALRRHGMTELADAIDGSVPGHYALKLKGNVKTTTQR
jgi:DNA-binding response OmpR family regulator